MEYYVKPLIEVEIRMALVRSGEVRTLGTIEDLVGEHKEASQDVIYQLFHNLQSSPLFRIAAAPHFIIFPWYYLWVVFS